MRTFRFYKDEIGWFVDLPEWTGEKWELQMVAGADLFLEMINSGDDEYQVYLTLSDEPFENSDVLELDCLGRIEGFEMGEGAWYQMVTYKGIEFDYTFWLCNVAKFVFGDFPKFIYYR